MQMVVVDDQSFERPSALTAVVVEFLAEQDVIQRLPRIPENMRVVDVSLATILLQGLSCIKIDIAAAGLKS